MTGLIVLVKYEQHHLNMTSPPETVNKTQLVSTLNYTITARCVVFNVYTAPTVTGL